MIYSFRRTLILVWLYLFIGLTAIPSFAQFVHASIEDMLPKAAKEHMQHIQSFPALWWNFIVVEFQKEPEPSDWQSLTLYCQKLKNDFQNSDQAGNTQNTNASHKGGIAQLNCGLDEPLKNPYLVEWLKNTTKLTPYTPDKMSTLKSTLAKASMPLPRPILDLLRHDPFDRANLLFERHQENFPQLEIREGYLYNQDTRRIVIPIQFKNAAQTDDTPLQIMNLVPPDETATTFIGAHFSAAQNEHRVRDDLARVGGITALFILFIIAGIFYYHKYHLLLVLPILLAATAIGALSVYFILGPMHALALSFGPGIVGLAIDYSLHNNFSHDERKTWRANLAGLLTTLIVFAVILASELPVLKQIALFSLTGLVSAFVLIYLFRNKMRVKQTKNTSYFNFTQNKKLQYAALILFLLALPLTFFTEYSLDMRDINFMDTKTQKTAAWLFHNEKGISPIFTVWESKSSDTIDKLHDIRDSLGLPGLMLNGPTRDIPRLNDQLSNHNTWCSDFMKSTGELENKFFSPYFESFNCKTSFHGIDLKNHIPAFVQDFHSAGKWLSIWQPATDQEEYALRSKFKDAFSRTDLAFIFPATFLKELKWMFPAAFVICLCVLLFFYRNTRLALLATLPFLYALVLVLATFTLMNEPLSFIAWIGLIIVFGFSLDYGVFTIENVHSDENDRHHLTQTFSVAATTTLAGFMPMLFCSHPVLKQLGITLSMGAIGTYVSATLLMPMLLRKLGTK